MSLALRAMTILQARKILGKSSKNFSDEQMQNLLNQLYGLAEVIFSSSLDGSNKLPKVIDQLASKEQNGVK